MALRGPPFELLHLAELCPLSLKTVKRVGDLQALSIIASCLEFGPSDWHSALLALPAADGEQGPNVVCPVRALRIYLESSSLFRQSEQLFVCFGGRSKGLQSKDCPAG